MGQTRPDGLDDGDVDVIRLVVGRYTRVFGSRWEDDFVSLALLELVDKLPQKGTHPNWKGYLHICVDGVISKFLKRENRQPKTLHDMDIATSAPVKLDLSQVTGMNKRILELLVQGYNVEEIAGLLGVAQSTIYKRIRGLKYSGLV